VGEPTHGLRDTCQLIGWSLPQEVQVAGLEREDASEVANVVRRHRIRTRGQSRRTLNRSRTRRAAAFSRPAVSGGVSMPSAEA